MHEDYDPIDPRANGGLAGTSPVKIFLLLHRKEQVFFFLPAAGTITKFTRNNYGGQHCNNKTPKAEQTERKAGRSGLLQYSL